MVSQSLKFIGENTSHAWTFTKGAEYAVLRDEKYGDEYVLDDYREPLYISRDDDNRFYGTGFESYAFRPVFEEELRPIYRVIATNRENGRATLCYAGRFKERAQNCYNGLKDKESIIRDHRVTLQELRPITIDTTE
ncbi:hypothetical protein bas04_0057 [Escherichia phage FritzSarasin]|nr:hypothetical protein bas04_0057 [Escherichia phage FritzSarasin]